MVRDYGNLKRAGEGAGAAEALLGEEIDALKSRASGLEEELTELGGELARAQEEAEKYKSNP